MGVRHQGGQVAGHEHLAVAVADDDAAGVGYARRHDHTRLLPADRQHRGSALDAAHGGTGGVLEVVSLLDVLGDQVRDDLRIGLGAKLVAACPELSAQLAVVLDDAVVDHDDVAVAVGVRMSVGLGCLAVGGPARVADTGVAHGQGAVDLAPQAGKLARVLGDGQGAVVVEDGEAGAVIAPVFELSQPVEHDGCRLLRAHVADDSTHAVLHAGAGYTGHT